MTKPPKSRADMKLEAFGTILMPSEAQEPILSPAVRTGLLDWLTEIWAKEELAAVGLQARRKAIFDGPPGVGKTTLAHHLAARLGLRLLAVRPDCIIDTWLGSTARNLGALFDAVAAEDEPIIIFFDEFDAIALKRKSSRQSADDEQNGWVNALLQRLEQHDGYIIAATNHSDHIDQAIWRRFEMHMSLELPGQDERERIIERYLTPYVLPADSLTQLAQAFATASPALMRQFCEGLKRQLVIGPMAGWDMSKQAAITRLITAIKPHPDMGKPRLWSQGCNDIAVQNMPWPLSSDVTAYATPDEPADAGPTIIPFRGKTT